MGLPIAAMAAAVVKTPAAGAQPWEGEALTIISNWTPTDLDPHGAYDPGSGLVITGPFEGLIRLAEGASHRFEPALAQSWESTPDKSRWTFHLRENVSFHDGSLLDAFAVRDSYERLFALALPPTNVLARFIESVEQVQVIDSLTVEFDLGRPQPMFEAAIAAPFGTAVVSVPTALQHEEEGDWGREWARNGGQGLGTGPYQVVEFDPLDRVVLERFAGYWGGWDGNHFDRIVIRIVPEAETRRELIEQSGADIALMISYDAVDELAANPDVVVDQQTNLVVRYLVMTQREPLASVEARQALCWAFPYEDVLKGVFQGHARPAYGPVSERCHGFSLVPPFVTDLDRAAAMFQRAGVAEGTRLTTVSADGNPLLQSIAELFQNNLAQIGIDLDIQLMDYASYIGMVYGDAPSEERPHLLPAFWSPDYDCAWAHLWATVSSNAWESGNIGHYRNDRIDKLLTFARDSIEEADYLAALAEIQRIAGLDDPAAIYFAQPEWITVRSSDVGGFVLNPVTSGMFDYHSLYRSTT